MPHIFKRKPKGGGSGDKPTTKGPAPQTAPTQDNSVVQEQVKQKAPTPHVSEVLDESVLKPSENEVNAMRARFEGSSTAQTEDAEYFSSFARYRKSDQQTTLHNRNTPKKAPETASPEEQAKRQDEITKHKAQVKVGRDYTKGMLNSTNDMRKRHLDRQIGDGARGGKKEKRLGSGQAGETFLTSFDSGKKGVFKGEGALPDEMSRMGVDMDHNMGASREVLSSRVAEMLGSDVVAKSEFAEVEGQQGALMDFAHGETAVDTIGFDEWGPMDQEEQQKVISTGILGQKGILKSNGFDYSDPVLQQKLIELQINDAITGQVDRHVGNYHIQQGEDGKVSGLTAFDNDGSFAPDYTKNEDTLNSFGDHVGHTVGLPPMMDESQASRIEGLDPVAVYQEVAKLLTEEEATAAMLRVWDLQDHVDKLRREGKIVKQWDDETYKGLKEAGAGNSYVARDGIMSETLVEGHKEYEEWQQQRKEGGIGGIGKGGMGISGGGAELGKLAMVDQDVEKKQGEVEDKGESSKGKKKKSSFRLPFGKKKKKE